jgi:hypothetical protein
LFGPVLGKPSDDLGDLEFLRDEDKVEDLGTSREEAKGDNSQ